MKKLLLGILILSTGFSSFAFALEMSWKRVVDGFLFSGSFSNGAKFAYRERSDGKRQLTYSNGSEQKVVSETELYGFPSFSHNDPRPYSPNENDRVLFLQGADHRMYVLTDTGAFSQVLEDVRRFPENSFNVNGNIADGYAMISSIYEDDIRKDKQTGETYVVRISDGAVALFDREYRPEVNAARVDAKNKLVVGLGPKFSLDKFETEALARAKNYPFSAPARKNSDANIYKTRFENGALLVTVTGAERRGVYLSVEGRRRVKVLDGPISWIQSPDHTFYDQKIILVENDKGIWAVNDSGKATRFELDYSKLGEVQNLGPALTYRSVAYKGVQYTVVSFTYRGFSPGKGEGETHIVREDGKAFRVDFNNYDLHQAPDIEVLRVREDGILQFAGGPREIDLEAFDAEATFKVLPANSEKDLKAIAAVDASYRNLGAIALATSKVSEADPEVLHEINAGLQMAQRRSVVVLGEAGVGKSETVESFIWKAVRGEIPSIPRTWRWMQLNPVTLNDGAGTVGDIEARVRNLTTASGIVPIVYVIDEIHSLRGTGTHSGSKNDVFQYFKTPLGSGELMVIGTSTTDEYNSAFMGDSALERRFTRVEMAEPKGERLFRNVKGWMTRFGKPVPDDDVIEYEMRIANAFDVVGSRMNKAIELWEKIFADMVIQGRRNEKPTRADVEAGAKKKFNADPAIFDLPLMNERLRKLRTLMDTKIIGQAQAKDKLFELVRQAVAGTHDGTKPRVRFLFTGPKGLGKTTLGYVVAEGLNLPAERFDMGNYGDHEAQRFLADLAAALRKKSAFTVIILDELEKAPKKIQETLFRVLDKGVFKVSEKIDTTADSATRRVDMSALNAIFFATGNAASGLVSSLFEKGGADRSKVGFKLAPDQKSVDPEKISVSVSPALLEKTLVEDHISEPLLDRFRPGIALALPPTSDEFRGVLAYHLKVALEEQMKRHEIGLKLENLEAYLDSVTKKHYRVGMTNREALEVIDMTVRSVLADVRLAGHGQRGDSVTLEFKDDQVRFKSCEKLLK